jgi:hypothetical protein
MLVDSSGAYYCVFGPNDHLRVPLSDVIATVQATSVAKPRRFVLSVSMADAATLQYAKTEKLQLENRHPSQRE